MHRLLSAMLFFSIFLSGCLVDSSEEMEPANLERLVLTNCEIAYSEDLVGEPVAPGISSWEPRSNPLLAIAALQIWDCDKISIGNQSFLEQQFGLFYRFDADPPESCLKYSQSFPAILKGILTNSEELAKMLSEILSFEVALGLISKPTLSEPADYEWSTGKGSGSLSQLTSSDFESDATYIDEFFWETTNGLGYLKLAYETRSTGSNEGNVLGQVSWPEEFAPALRPWVGSDYIRHEVSPSIAMAQFAATNCKETIA